MQIKRTDDAMGTVATLGKPLIPRLGCTSCPIRKRAVCAMSAPEELDVLDSIKSYRSYQPGEAICMTGEETGFVGSVVYGNVSLKRIMPDGRRQMVGLLFPSDFLGRPHRPEAPYDAEAVGEVTLCTFDRKRFATLLDSSSVLEQRLLRMTLDELDAAREWMLLLGRKTAREKLASFIAMVGRRNGTLDAETPANGTAFDLPITREDMAEFLGLTFETVSRQVSALKRDGLIQLVSTRRIVVPDYAALMDAAGDDSDGGMVV